MPVAVKLIAVLDVQATLRIVCWNVTVYGTDKTAFAAI